nr:MAG TPA_asm: hypothetical protein [Caudoviricetes sp.]
MFQFSVCYCVKSSDIQIVFFHIQFNSDLYVFTKYLNKFEAVS